MILQAEKQCLLSAAPWQPVSCAEFNLLSVLSVLVEVSPEESIWGIAAARLSLLGPYGHRAAAQSCNLWLDIIIDGSKRFGVFMCKISSADLTCCCMAAGTAAVAQPIKVAPVSGAAQQFAPSAATYPAGSPMASVSSLESGLPVDPTSLRYTKPEEVRTFINTWCSAPLVRSGCQQLICTFGSNKISKQLLACRVLCALT